MWIRRSNPVHVLLAVCLLICFDIEPSRAQDLPPSLIKIVVPYPAGGGTDAVARVLASNLAVALGTAVVVENRTGGASIPATDSVAKAAADGGTLLLVTDHFAVNYASGQRLPYDTRKDFQLVVKLVNVPFILSANAAKTDFNNLQQFVKFAKVNPGKLTFGSLGRSSPQELIMTYFAKRQGIDVLNVPYRGMAPALQGVVSGEIDVTFTGIAQSEQFFLDRKIRRLAATSSARLIGAPDVRTAQEQGFPDLTLVTWYGIVAPAEVPQALIERYQREFQKIMQLPEMKSLVTSIGGEVSVLASSEFARFLDEETNRYRHIIKETGIKFQ